MKGKMKKLEIKVAKDMRRFRKSKKWLQHIKNMLRKAPSEKAKSSLTNAEINAKEKASTEKSKLKGAKKKLKSDRKAINKAAKQLDSTKSKLKEVKVQLQRVHKQKKTASL